MPFSLLAAVLLLAAPLGLLAQDTEGWYKAHPGMSRVSLVNQETFQLTDEFGRTRFFHGTNAIMKSPPWYLQSEWVPGITSFGERDVKYIRELGMNVVRLGHSWAGAMPERNQLNQTWFDIMQKQTKLAEDHGIYILVDAHQDLLARQNCGNGAPDWAVKSSWLPKWLRYPFPFKLESFPENSMGIPTPWSICNTVTWGPTYMTPSVGGAFEKLYNNYDGLADSFAAFWTKLASTYAQSANVVGYDLLNEPWVGDAWKYPWRLIPGVADHEVIEPFMNRISKAIRTVDNDTLIWFEGATMDILSGYREAPLGQGSKSVQSYHYYRPPQLGSIYDTIYNRQKDSRRLKCGGVLTEFWFRMGNPKSMDELATHLKATDEKMVSWMGWTYNYLYQGWTGNPDVRTRSTNDTTGVPYPELVKHYSRPYPAAVAGNPKSYGWDENTGTFKLQFTADPQIEAPTEIMLSPIKFPDGYSVQITPEGSLKQYKRDDRTLALFTSDSIKTLTDISVVIIKN